MPVLLLKATLIAILIVVIVDDLKNYRIKNANVLLALGMTLVILALSKPVADIGLHVLVAAVLFPFLVLAYARRAMGGGDAKLIAVALLWTGPQFSLLFALALLVCILCYWTAVKLGLAPFQRVAGPNEGAVWAEHRRRLDRHAPCICSRRHRVACLLVYKS